MTKKSKKSPQSVEIKRVTKTPPRVEIFNREIRYLKVKDVKRAYSKLIQDYCRGVVLDEQARTLVYMFSGYLQIIRDVEFEDKLNKMEKILNESKTQT